MGILPDNFICPDCGFSFRLNPIKIWKAHCPKCGSTIPFEEFGRIHGYWLAEVIWVTLCGVVFLVLTGNLGKGLQTLIDLFTLIFG